LRAGGSENLDAVVLAVHVALFPVRSPEWRATPAARCGSGCRQAAR